MLQDIKELYGKKLSATDGDIGEVKDFYFDDISWAVRYLVAETGTWLTGRQVLLSPHAFATAAFGRSDAVAGLLHVNLTREQIEGSPPIDAHLPVSRQYEEEYYRYYGWQNYWQNGGMWGMAGFAPAAPPPLAEDVPHHGHNQREDIHLRSTLSVQGYQIQTTDGQIGSVSSFLVDDKDWTIRELAVEAGHWYAGKTILILPKNITRISYEDSTVFVNLTKEDIKQTIRNDVAQPAASSS